METPEHAVDLTAKEKKLQKHRLRMNILSVVNFALQSLIMALYAWAGTVSWEVVIGFFAVSVGSSAAFTLLIAANWNLRFREKGLLVPQFALALAIELLFLAIAPQLAVVYLGSILVFFNFTMVRFNEKQFLLIWLLYGAGSALALYAARGHFSYPGVSDAEIAILWLFFFLAIRRLTMIGAQFSHLRSQLSEKNRLLEDALEKNVEMANRDDLTGIHNRRHFMTLLAEEKARAERSGQDFCVAMFDLDRFKSVNDRYGHLTGDMVLKEFSKTVLSSMRSTDRFARYGGEEFVLMLTAPTSIDTAAVAVERIRKAVEDKDWNTVTPGLRVTVSGGIAASQSQESLEELLDRADHALYEAKNAGRNRVQLARWPAKAVSQAC